MPDSKLFTPGPLNTHASVREAMLSDYGSRDTHFIGAVADIRQRLVALGGSSAHEAVLLQGSGTYAMESAIDTFLGESDRLLVTVNGAYGRRAVQIAARLGVDVVSVEVDEDVPFTGARLHNALTRYEGVTHVWAVHCETTTGIMNHVEEMGQVASGAGCRFMVDAMSTFGGVHLDLEEAAIDVLLSSANKCIEGVPGFAFMLIGRDLLEESEGRARSTSLDAHAQWAALEKNGQFRFTPPTHTIMAFRQALRELDREGGTEARHARYRRNRNRLHEGLRGHGFTPYLKDEDQGVIISTFLTPEHPSWVFEEVYDRLAAEGLIIYPGKLTRVNSFRIGHIGQLTDDDLDRLVASLGRTVSSPTA